MLGRPWCPASEKFAPAATLWRMTLRINTLASPREVPTADLSFPAVAIRRHGSAGKTRKLTSTGSWVT